MKLEKTSKVGKEAKRFTYVAWDITNKCNLRCKHCYNANKYFENDSSEISDEECFEVLNKLIDENVESINFLGGEPLLRNNIKDLLKVAVSNNIITMLTTNGVFLDLETYKMLSEIGVHSIAVSIDGTEQINDLIRGKGVYSKVIQNLIDINEYKQNHKGKYTNLSISFTATRKNMDNMLELFQNLYECGIRSFIVGMIMEAGNGVTNSEQFKLNNFNEKESLLMNVENTVRCLYDKYSDLYMQIELRPMFVKYLKDRYSENISYSINYSKCFYKLGLIYIESNGDLHPCNVYNIPKIKSFDFKNYENTKVNIRSVQNLRDENLMNSFGNFDNMFKMANKDRKIIDLCANCNIKEDCQPCPFQFRDELDYYECLFAEKRYNDFYNQMRGLEISISTKRKFSVSNSYMKFFNNIKSGTVEDNFNVYCKYFGENVAEYVKTLILFEKIRLIDIN